jgi:hypothetical protein
MTALGSTEMIRSPFDVAEDFAGLARVLNGGGDLDETLERICSMVVERLPGECHAGVAILDPRRRLSTRGATDPLPPAVDRHQYETHEGPCLDVVDSLEMVTVPDLGGDRRWPQFAMRAVKDTGVRSMMSFRLFTTERVLGGLNLYSEVPGAFSSDSPAAHWGKVYAVHASLALAGARAQADLKAALESRETISVAIGLLMARENVSRQEAFDILRRASQRMNIKLRDVAAKVAGGEASVLSGRP